MSLRRTIALCLTLLAGCTSPSSKKSLDDTVLPSVAVMIVGGGLLRVEDAKSYPKVFLVAWPDGKMIWSENQAEGGPPFLVGKTEPERIHKLIADFDSRSVFDESKFRHSWFGPDSKHHSIWLRNREKYTRVETWHELFERNENLVAIDGGITSLDGKSREEMIRSDKSEFRDFRNLWNDLRSATSQLVPKQGQYYDNPVVLDLPR